MRAPYFMILLIALACILNPRYAHAAFPVHVHTNPSTPVAVTEQQPGVANISQLLPFSSEKASNANATADWMGVAALVLGIASLLFIVASAITPIISALWLPSVILAIVFGGIGLKGKNRSMAKAGMIIGIIELALVVFIAILAIVAWTNHK